MIVDSNGSKDSVSAEETEINEHVHTNKPSLFVSKAKRFSTKSLRQLLIESKYVELHWSSLNV